MPTITVLVNQSEIEIEAQTNLLQLLQKVNTSTDGIAVALNNTIVTKSAWQAQQFQQNDTILIIKATQGG